MYKGGGDDSVSENGLPLHNGEGGDDDDKGVKSDFLSISSSDLDGRTFADKDEDRSNMGKGKVDDEENEEFWMEKPLLIRMRMGATWEKARSTMKQMKSFGELETSRVFRGKKKKRR